MLRELVAKVLVRLQKKTSRFVESEAEKTNGVLLAFGAARGSQASLLVIGANNGVENDPFVHHALKFGWRAVLVEPNPGVFRELHSSFGSLQKITCVNAAISTKPSPLRLFTIAFSAKRWATGLSSASEAILLKHFQTGWVQQMCERFGDTFPENPDNWIRAVDVPCMKIAQLVAETGVDKFDILAVDTEGMDAEIVNSALDEGYRPAVICWEHLHLAIQINDSLIERCKNLGYHACKDSNNIICFQSEYLLGNSITENC